MRRSTGGELKAPQAFLLSMLVGVLAWGLETAELIVLALFVVPILANVASRIAAGSAMAGYLIGATLFLFYSVLHYHSAHWMIWTLWAGSTLLYSCLAASFWSKHKSYRAFAAVILLVLTTFYPFGLLFVPHPLLALASVTPHMGMVGLVASVLLLVVAALLGPKVLGLTVSIMVVIGVCNLSLLPVQQNTSGWHAVTTHIGSADIRNDQKAYFRNRAFAAAVKAQNVKKVILPEFSAGDHHRALEDLWSLEPDIESRFVLLGAIGHQDLKLSNQVLLVHGEKVEVVYKQRYPIPLVMWRFWESISGFSSSRNSRVVEIEEEKMALFLCYESLVLPALTETLVNKPDILVGMSSTPWSPSPIVRQLQEKTLSLWGMLLGVPSVVAHNY